MPQQYRYGSTIKNYRKITTSLTSDSTTISRSGPQLLRHSQKENPWIGQNIDQVLESDIPYTGTGKDIDIIVVDNGIRIAHVEFCNSIVNRAKNPTAYLGGNVLNSNGYCGVLDIILDAPYYIDPDWFNSNVFARLETRWDGTVVPKDEAARLWWSSENFRSPNVAPPGGINIPVNYTRINACGNATTGPFDGDHGTPVASCLYGRTQGWAFNANKWTIWLDAFDGNYDLVFLIQQIFHQYKPTNVAKGNRNPTISSNSWEFINQIDGGGGYLHYRGSRYPFDAPDTRSNWTSFMKGIRFIAGAGHSAELQTNSITTRAADCVNAGVIFVAAAGNTNQQLVNSSHPNYDNFWSYDGEGGFENNTHNFGEGFTFYNSLNRRGFPSQSGSFTESGQRIYPVILVGSLGTNVPAGVTTYAREYKDDSSSYGDAVDCFATGEDVLAANHVNNTGISRWDNTLIINSTEYRDRPISGTSFAAPTAAGIIACKIETNRTWNYSNIKNWLLASCGRATNSKIYGVGVFTDPEDIRWEDRYRINTALPPVIIWNADNTESLATTPADPTYTATISKSEINEGSSMTVTLTTTDHPQDTLIYWTWSGTATLTDFDAPESTSGSGYVNSTTKKLTVTFTAKADLLTEGSENIKVRFWLGGPNQGTAIATSEFIFIKDTSKTPVVVKTFALSSEKTSYNEGETINWVINTTNVPNGTGIEWRLQGTGSSTNDIIGDTSGTATIQDNTAQIQTQIVEDLTTEGVEPIVLQIKTPTNNDPFNVSRSVIIADTSIDPLYTLTPSSTIVNEGDTIEFTINTVNVTFPVIIYYENVGSSTNNDFDNDIKGSITLNSSTTIFAITVKEDTLTEVTQETLILNLRINSEFGKIVAKATIRIRDSSKSPDTLLPVILPRPPVILPDIINTSVNITSIVTLTNIIDVPTWKNPTNLGTIQVGEVSEIRLEANTRQNFPLYYTLINGSLPIGLNLEKDGSINGVVEDVFPSTTSTNYNFIVGIKKIGKPFISTSSFRLTVTKTTSTVYTQVYAEPLLTESRRKAFFDLVEDKNIFPREILYRPLDPNFGVQRKLQLVIHHGIEQLDVQDFINTISQNFYKRRYLLNTIKVGNAENENGEAIYEVIYLDIVDQNSKEDGTSLSKSIFIQGAQYFPSSLINMRARFEDTGKFTDQRNPKFMKTAQPYSTKELGYVPAVPICYTLPGKSKLILNKLQRLKINWNQYDFTIDKIFIKDLSTGNIISFRLPKNPTIT